MYPRSRRRHAARTRRSGELAKAIQKRIDEEESRYDEVMGDLSRGGYFADTKVWTGKKAKDMADSGAPVVLTYDGAGYDYLSSQGEMEYMGGSQLRTDIRNLAARMGYMTEDLTSWAMGFYPDSSAEEYHPPKREMPQWMREELEAEFGPFETGEPKKEQPLPEEQQRIMREMRMSSTRRRHALQAPLADLERRVKDLMFDLADEPSVPWEAVSARYLAEEGATFVGHPEWLQDENHPVWDWAYEVLDEAHFDQPSSRRRESVFELPESGQDPWDDREYCKHCDGPIDDYGRCDCDYEEEERREKQRQQQRSRRDKPGQW